MSIPMSSSPVSSRSSSRFSSSSRSSSRSSSSSSPSSCEITDFRSFIIILSLVFSSTVSSVSSSSARASGSSRSRPTSSSPVSMPVMSPLVSSNPAPSRLASGAVGSTSMASASEIALRPSMYALKVSSNFNFLEIGQSVFVTFSVGDGTPSTLFAASPFLNSKGFSPAFLMPLVTLSPSVVFVFFVSGFFTNETLSFEIVAF